MCSLWPDASCPPCQRTCPVGKWLQIDTIFSISQLLALFCVSLLLLREDMNFLFHRESAVTGLYSFSRFHCYHSTKKDRVYQSCLNCIWNYFLSSSSSTASYQHSSSCATRIVFIRLEIELQLSCVAFALWAGFFWFQDLKITTVGNFASLCKSNRIYFTACVGETDIYACGAW